MARILCLDDSVGMLGILRLVFEKAGHECLTTADNQEAFSILRTHAIDLVTQDWFRPEMGAVGFLRVMKSDKALRSIPVLVIASGAMAEDRAESLKQVGLDPDRDLAGYVTKPFDPSELLTTIEAILEKRSKPAASE